MQTPHSKIHWSLGLGLFWLVPILIAALLAFRAQTGSATTTYTTMVIILVGSLFIAFWRYALGPMRELRNQKEHLESLYAFSNFLADASLENLSIDLSSRVCDLMQADAVALRLCGIGDAGFSIAMNHESMKTPTTEQYLHLGTQALAELMTKSSAQRLLLDDLAPEALHPCRLAGMRSLIYVPVRAQQRTLAEIALYYRREIVLDEGRKELIDSISRHLAVTLENQRMRALDRESAILTERHFIARELHDSIAQSLGFLKIQIHLLRKAIDKGDQDMATFVLAELDAGLANSISDVRELLVHFRTRVGSGEIQTAIQETLQKFQNQSGLKANFETSGTSPELAPDVQIQVLNVLQESLSNIRKHAQASRVDIELVRGTTWRLLVRDDGKGFDTRAGPSLFNVGMNIMRERAEMIGATLSVDSIQGSGTTVTLCVPQSSTIRTALPTADASGEGRPVQISAAMSMVPDTQKT